jgi:hypothetical protein
MSITTLIVLSDPSNGEEALGRVFNALAAAYDFEQRKQPVQIVFQGAGTRWPSVLQDAQHPVNGLYSAVKHRVLGASTACSAFFGATEGVESAGLNLLSGNAVPGTPGLPSVAEFAANGSVIAF